MSPYINHASELTDSSQQASTACSVNTFLLMLRRSTILTTVSPKSAEQVVGQNSIQHKPGNLISHRKKKFRGFVSEMKVLKYYAILTKIFYLILE